MSERNRKHLETIKNIALVVLFITTILLLYLVWSKDSGVDFRISSILPIGDEEYQIPSTADVLTADRIVYCTGNSSFMVDENDEAGVYDRAISSLRTLADSASVLVSEITKEQYTEAVSGYKSVQLVYGFHIPFRELQETYNIKRITGSDAIESVRALAFSAAAPESIFVWDSNAQKYYRLLSDKDTVSVEQWLASLTATTDLYYPVGDVLGGDNKNLMPLTLSTNITQIRYEDETGEAGEKIRITMAEALFGENFDFVRRIKDSFGTITYMYGYGQKTFTTTVDGVFEYKTDVSNGSSQGFMGDLTTAIQFVAANGSWDSLNGQRLDFKLTGAEPKTDGRHKGYTFTFGENINDRAVYYTEGSPITVDVLDGQVSYYRRDVVSVASPVDDGQGEAQLPDAANVLALNYNYMYKSLTNTPLSPNTEDAFSYVADAITYISTGYVRVEDDKLLLPAWIIETEPGMFFYFNLMEATPIGNSR